MQGGGRCRSAQVGRYGGGPHNGWSGSVHGPRQRRAVVVRGRATLIENRIYQGNSLDLVQEVADESVHLILSDIPYGVGADEWDVLHGNSNSAYLGSSDAQERAGAVFEKRRKPINGWCQADREIPRQYQEWCSRWSSEWLRVLKPGASAIVFSGRRLSHRCVCAMEDAGFNFKDSLAWTRKTAPHRAQRLSVVYSRRDDHENAKAWEGWRVGNLRPVYEPILWFTKPYKIGGTIASNVLQYGVGAYNEVAYTRYTGRPANLIECGMAKGEGGLHPTQKPVQLMRTLIELTTLKGQLVLDPFAGSGSTLLAAQLLQRRFIGFEQRPDYVDICEQRLAPVTILTE